jgi:hypothetical protein
MERITDLLIPVNPGYDFSADPGGQPEYVNPVTLNNMEVRYANAAIQVVDRVTRSMKKLAQFKADLDEAEQAVEDFESDLLRLHPPPRGEKTLKLIDAHILRIAEQEGTITEYRAKMAKTRDLKRQIIITDAAVDAGRLVLTQLKMVGEHGQTHLSFVKNEYKQARGYA